MRATVRRGCNGIVWFAFRKRKNKVSCAVFFMILTLVSEAVSGRAKTHMAYRKKYKPYILK